MLSPINKDNIELQKQYAQQKILEAREVFQIQKKAFQTMPFPEEKLRKQQLKAFKKAIIKYKDKLIKAICADFGHRSTDETLLTDLLLTIINIKHARKNIRCWMRSEKRSVDLLFQPAKARVMYQPLGVVGIMAPWNFPVYLLFAPLTAAIAAGNRVMLKPSEHSPYCNRVLNEIISEAFLKDEVFIIEGNAEVAKQFSQLPFDHLLFTGSTEVGKQIMVSAANNLTPVTLELGGKSPAIIAPDIKISFAVERLLYGKCLNSGQHCVAPDYILCPENKLTELISEMKKQFNVLYPEMSNGDYTSIINDEQYQRIVKLLEDAQTKGAKIIPLANTDTSLPRQMPLTLITDTNLSMQVLKEEIFGPLLPIVIYKNWEETLGIIHSLPRPLAFYLFTNKQTLVDQMLYSTHSGGVAINDAATQVAQNDLPFGGVGLSGMGSYHGRDGFLTFSHKKSIFKRGYLNSAKYVYPPYKKLIHRLIYRWYLN
ncbi:coniferyl aldehyde dehydrogenase [Aliikangiella sp. IMCC44359]|uniref:coniferyl aldehyde dehydrogenase n=1 Tax=Aliikangiella sp. IMCC44359 TaxID=3459125 RepID=UPI00403AED36